MALKDPKRYLSSVEIQPRRMVLIVEFYLGGYVAYWAVVDYTMA